MVNSRPVETFVLSNGLRVILAPDHSAAVAAVAVVYDVGMRSEPEGRTGFAHLFEHMMFQGSANVAKAEHMQLVQAAGGQFNGSTHVDYTDYYNVVPANALRRVLFLEADRMAGPAVTRENLDNQVDVVKEEIRVRVMNQPYGGFPWTRLPQVMFETFPNAHDGIGSFSDLEAATVDDAQDFFDTYYPPSNAVLSIVGDFDIAEVTSWVREYFEPIPARATPALPELNEPDAAGGRWEDYTDALAPLPAFVSAWRTPDPLDDLDGFLAHVVLTDMLADGEASRLVRRLVQDEQKATEVGSYVSVMGEPYATRGPAPFQVIGFLPPGGNVSEVVDIVDEEIKSIADSVDYGDRDRVIRRAQARFLRAADSPLARARNFATAQIFHDSPEFIHRLPDLLRRVDNDAVSEAARRLTADRRTVLEVKPGGAQ
ncbi:M16 family metallopeptidase [Haloglycomyces albus]|uniref:M16 family metallopeptidase n=1 Tax=Haloglycomyces albus TaxID=526067 RepID=UPI00046CF048|nr:pitrilysin family protein [Haloglycomyces albus]